MMMMLFNVLLPSFGLLQLKPKDYDHLEEKFDIFGNSSLPNAAFAFLIVFSILFDDTNVKCEHKHFCLFGQIRLFIMYTLVECTITTQVIKSM